MRAVTIILLLSLCSVSYSQSHDLVLGRALPGDLILYKVNEWKYGFPLLVRTSVIEYPELGQSNFAIITAIVIIDNNYDGHGGYPVVEAGGVGQDFVKIKLESERSYGFNFTITIYGRNRIFI
nr:venom polypeptide precursor [Doratifera vulnerans]